MQKISLIVAVVLSCVVAVHAAPFVTTVNWADANNGELNGVDVSLTGLTGVTSVSNFFLNFPPGQFDAAPLGSTPLVVYGADSNWTVTFSEPLTDLLLYVYSWRGNYTNGDSDPTTTYNFSESLTHLSGLDGAIVGADVLTLPPDHPDPVLYYGIVRFDGPIETLSVRSDAPTPSGNGLTFGIWIPEPGTVTLLGLGVFSLVARCGRRW